MLKDGATAEEGTHESLLADASGVYYNLVHAQSLEIGSTEEDTGITEDEIDTNNLPLEREKSKSSKLDCRALSL